MVLKATQFPWVEGRVASQLLRDQESAPVQYERRQNRRWVPEHAGKSHPTHADTVVCFYCEFDVNESVAFRHGGRWSCGACYMVALGQFFEVDPMFLDCANKVGEDLLMWMIQVKIRDRVLKLNCTILTA